MATNRPSLNCGEHGRWSRRCAACVQIRRWYDAGETTPGVQRARTSADDAYAAGMVELLAQREISVGRAAMFCERLLAEHAGRP